MRILIIGAMAALLSAPLAAMTDEGVMVISSPDAVSVELNAGLSGGFDQMGLTVAAYAADVAHVAYKPETVEAAGIPLDELSGFASDWPSGFTYGLIETVKITDNGALQVAACSSCHSGRPNTSG